MSVIDDYLAKLNLDERTELGRVRDLIHVAVPEAEEVIRYGIPGFQYKGKYLGGFSAFKDHLSLFPTGGPIEAYQDRLVGYKLSKGTIQFTLDHPLPDQLIKDLYCHRAASIDQKKY